MQELDERLIAGKPTACQVGVFYLTYFPKEYRFHFNAHNLIVVDKQGDDYIISDPIMETLVSMNSYELQRVRFAKGHLHHVVKCIIPAIILKKQLMNKSGTVSFPVSNVIVVIC
ncbi:BtrH N-terminal domain-containing protein [Niabella sp. W65]|nr:BtrH N-terminal domain-containing protein [Niabella sp. W65]MCH7368818.1 BtrH N-terminal domain-containing protein [Niabella sp. W65]